MGVRALFRGPMHILEWCDEEVIALAGRDGRGMPVKESFPEHRWHDVQVAMDEAYTTGRPVTLTRPLGLLVAVPRRDARGRIVGVGTYFELAPVQRSPRLDQEPQPLDQPPGHPAAAPGRQ